MKQLLRLALPIALLSTACQKNPDSIIPPGPNSEEKFSIRFNQSRYGLEQLDYSEESLVLTSNTRFKAMQMRITAANGLKDGQSEVILFRITTNDRGIAMLPITRHDLCRYRDGKLYIEMDYSASFDFIKVDSTVKEEYKIRNFADFVNIENSLKDAYPDEPFVQVDNIICPNNFNFENDHRLFSGTYDGQNYKIHNFNQQVNRPSAGSADWIGLFGSLQPHSVVKNIQLETISLRSIGQSAYGGGIAAMADSAVILNCSVKGNIIADTTIGFTYIGGIVGKATNTSIIGCSQSGDLVGAVTGGIISVGSNDTVKTCYKTGGIYVNSTAGGIMAFGFGDATINVYDSYVYLTALRARYYYALYRKSENNGTISNYYTNADNIVNPVDPYVGNTGYTLYSTVAELNNHLAANTAYKANPDQSMPKILWWQ
jgi:hypothetical protein